MRRTFLTAVFVTCLFLPLMAQPATPAQMAGVEQKDGFGIFHFQTRLGSFKVIDGQGRLEFDFKGTVLLSNVNGNFSVTGKVRKEYEKHGRTLYSGTGHVVVTGSWRAVQWFGRDVKGAWYGAGVIRLSGEFDKEQKTGEYWFEDPNKVAFWPGGSTIDMPVPQRVPGINKNVKIKK